jgi:hypothetical protein
MNSNSQSDERDHISSIPIHVPPIVGEYAYYDSRINTQPFVINNRSKGCHFSSPVNTTCERWITNNGIINEINS